VRVANGLPLGGVGTSGYGQYTGKFGFDTFTHLRSSMDTPTFLDIALKSRYPPYTVRHAFQSATLDLTTPTEGKGEADRRHDEAHASSARGREHIRSVEDPWRRCLHGHRINYCGAQGDVLNSL
jgi:hypothetical protein